jgi:predicted nucleic acid-binding protein
MVVIDAGAVGDLLLGWRAAERVGQLLAEHDEDVHAPHLLDIEVLDFFSRAMTMGALSESHATNALSDFLELSVERYPHTLLAARVWDLRPHFSAPDAIYLALAENLNDDGVPLITSDADFARAARKHTGVEVLLAA